jgi:tRNA nucleotidyltransferase (CCA-adding enzyme)
MNEVEKKVLQKITPTHEYREKVKEIVEEVRIILEKEIKKRKIQAKVQLVGSIAKDTYLQSNMDIDFFICFPTNYKKDEIAKHALSIGKSFLKNTEESYAEHPYLRGYYKKFYTEIVPCYKIENAEQKLTAVDRTPLHTKYVKEHITENQKQEVRLFKQFLKGINCYGAEAQIQGFSGYLCEIIILYYKTFENTIKKASQWKKQIKLSLTTKDFSGFDTPLVFIDPVDSNRNVASALVEEKFDLFVNACREYLKEPKYTFFFPNPVKPWTIDKIKKTIQKQACRYIGIKFEKPEIIDENLYPQIRKTARTTFENLERYDFKVYDSVYFVDDKNIYMIVKTQKEPLSKTMIHSGPPITKKENAEEFLKKWKNNSLVVKGPYKENNRWYVEIKRQHTDAKKFLEKEFEKLSLGKHIDKVVNKKYKVLEIDKLLSENLKVFWTEYFDKIMSWER